MSNAMRAVIPAVLLALVERPVISKGKVVMEGSGEKATPKMRKIAATEVLDYADRGDRVVVVTTDGHKFAGAIPPKLREQLDRAAEPPQPPQGGSTPPAKT